VGSWNYPKVFVGPLVPPVIGDTCEMDLPEAWGGRSLESIVEMRTSLVRSKDAMPVEAVRDPNRALLLMQEIVMSDRPVDTELTLEKKPRFSLNLSEFSAPHGPSEMLKSLDLAQNPHIPRAVDSVYNDDFVAAGGMMKLYRKGIETSHIAKLLSAGIMGEQKRRKFVPTRWSITATDDMISKNLLKEVRAYPSINDTLVFSHSEIGNTLVAIMTPGVWSFEFLESWLKDSLFGTASPEPSIISDWEYYSGRKDYAAIVAGAYYAGRLPVVEYLHEMGRQATCFVIMEVDTSYHTPIGVWRVRTILAEALRRAPAVFGSLDEAFASLNQVLANAPSSYQAASQLLNFTSRQKVLDEWMN
jgi:hypothetical protein